MKNKKCQYRVPGEALIKCVDDAGLDRNLVNELRNNVQVGGKIHHTMYTCTCLQV